MVRVRLRFSSTRPFPMVPPQPAMQSLSLLRLGLLSLLSGMTLLPVYGMYRESPAFPQWIVLLAMSATTEVQHIPSATNTVDSSALRKRYLDCAWIFSSSRVSTVRVSDGVDLMGAELVVK